MLERRTNVSQFEGVKALAKRIEDLTKERDELTRERQDSQTKLLEEHSVTLAEVKVTLALLVDRTAGLPGVIEGIKARLTAQEKWKILMTGYAAAFGIMGAFLGWITTLIFGTHR